MTEITGLIEEEVDGDDLTPEEFMVQKTRELYGGEADYPPHDPNSLEYNEAEKQFHSEKQMAYQGRASADGSPAPWLESPWLAPLTGSSSPIDLATSILGIDRKTQTDYVRGLASGVTLGATEYLQKLHRDHAAGTGTGEGYEKPGSIAHTAGDITGSVIGAGKLYKGAKALTKMVSPRLTRMGAGGVAELNRSGRIAAGIGEGAATETARGAFTPGEEALESGAFGAGTAALVEIPVSLMGGAYASGIRAIATQHANTLREGVDEMAKRYGIPTLATARNIGNSWGEWFETKAAQTSAAHQTLREFLERVDAGFHHFREETVDFLGAYKGWGNRGMNDEVGKLVSKKFLDYVDNDLKGNASKMYDELMDLGSGYFEKVDPTELLDSLKRLIKKEGFRKAKTPGVQRLREFIKRHSADPPAPVARIVPPKTTGTSYTTAAVPTSAAKVPASILRQADPIPEPKLFPLQAIWKEGTNLYPNKKIWDDDDYLMVKANAVIKRFVRKIGTEHPDAVTAGKIETLFEQADALWGKGQEILESSFGKIIKKSKPEKVVDNMTKDISSLQATRQVMGDDFTNNIAQTKIRNMMSRAMEEPPNPDIIAELGKPFKPGEKHFSYFKFSKMANKVAGGAENVEKYWDEMLKTIPEEARNAFHEFRRMAKAYDEPYRRLLPTKEGIAGGGEVASLAVVASKLNSALRILVQFATGKGIAETFISGPPSQNPLLGGWRPNVDEASKAAGFLNVLRRGVTQTGRAAGLPQEE